MANQQTDLNDLNRTVLSHDAAIGELQGVSSALADEVANLEGDLDDLITKLNGMNHSHNLSSHFRYMHASAK